MSAVPSDQIEQIEEGARKVAATGRKGERIVAMSVIGVARISAPILRPTL